MTSSPMNPHPATKTWSPNFTREYRAMVAQHLRGSPMHCSTGTPSGTFTTCGTRRAVAGSKSTTAWVAKLGVNPIPVTRSPG
jgi:hypothetical protein